MLDLTVLQLATKAESHTLQMKMPGSRVAWMVMTSAWSSAFRIQLAFISGRGSICTADSSATHRKMLG